MNKFGIKRQLLRKYLISDMKKAINEETVVSILAIVVVGCLTVLLYNLIYSEDTTRQVPHVQSRIGSQN